MGRHLVPAVLDGIVDGAVRVVDAVALDSVVPAVAQPPGAVFLAGPAQTKKTEPVHTATGFVRAVGAPSPTGRPRARRHVEDGPEGRVRIARAAGRGGGGARRGDPAPQKEGGARPRARGGSADALRRQRDRSPRSALDIEGARQGVLVRAAGEQDRDSPTRTSGSENDGSQPGGRGDRAPGVLVGWSTAPLPSWARSTTPRAVRTSS